MIWLQDVVVPMLGPPGVMLSSFVDSFFVSLPEVNDLLVVGAAAADPRQAWVYAAAATCGSVIGCVAVWLVGRRGGELLLARRLGPQRMERTRALLERRGTLALALPALLPPPMPFKVFVIAAGVFGYPLRRTVLVLGAARGLRYAGLAWLGLHHGPASIELLRRGDAWIAERLPLLVVLSLVAVVGGVLLHGLRRRRLAPAVEQMMREDPI